MRFLIWSIGSVSRRSRAASRPYEQSGKRLRLEGLVQPGRGRAAGHHRSFCGAGGKVVLAQQPELFRREEPAAERGGGEREEDLQGGERQGEGVEEETMGGESPGEQGAHGVDLGADDLQDRRGVGERVFGEKRGE